MTIEFDDLIPKQNQSVEFDDLIPKKPAKGFFSRIADAFTQDRPLADSLPPQMQVPLAALRAMGPKPSVMEGVKGEPAPFDFNTASRLARAIDDGKAPPLPLPNSLAIEQEAQRAQQAGRAEARRQFARDNPVLGGLASGSANVLAGTINAPQTAAAFVNKTFVDPVLGLAGAGPMPSPGTMPGTEYLTGAARDYSPRVGRQSMAKAWDRDQFGEWLMVNLAQQSPQIAQSVMAALVPPLRATILPAMGAQAAGSAYVDGDDPRVAVAKGFIEAGTEMLPLGAFDRVAKALAGLPEATQRSVLSAAGRKLLAAGGAVTANSATGAIEEALAQFGGNVLDRYASGKNVGLMDKVPDAAVLGAAAGGVMSTPQVAVSLMGKKEPEQAQPVVAPPPAPRIRPSAPADESALQALDQYLAGRQLASAINQDSQAFADAPPQRTVQQTVARIMGQPLPAPAPAPASASASVPASAPAPASDISTVPDSVFSSFPDMIEADSGLININQFTQQEQDALRAAGMVSRGVLESGQTHEGVSPEMLWSERERRFQSARQNRRGVTQSERDEGIERRAVFYDRLADEQDAMGELGSAEQAAEYRRKAAEIRARKGGAPISPVASAEARANPPAAPAPAPAAPTTTPAPASAPAASPVTPEQAAVAAADAMARYGRDGIDLAQGGKPFKTRAAASQARKLQPHLRVVSHPGGGYVLANKTPAQLAAQEKAARRLRQANVGQKGQPLAAHEFIAAEGGLRQDVRSDLGIEGNPRIGNRTLYAAPGKGLTIEQATEKLQEAGYLQSDLHNDAFDLIRRSLTQAPQYTAEGFERQAEAELQAQYEDHLRAQQEAAQQEDFDPFTDLAELGFTEEDGDAAGYWQASPELQAEVRALANRLDDMGGDSESLFEDLVRQYPDLPQQEFYETARQAITDAIAQLEAAQQGGRGDSGQDDGRQARQDSGPDAQDQGLSAEQAAAPAAQSQQQIKPLSSETFDSWKRQGMSRGAVKGWTIFYDPLYDEYRLARKSKERNAAGGGYVTGEIVTQTFKTEADARRWASNEADAADTLTSYTPADIEQRVDKLEQAEKDRQAADREDQRRAQADAERDDFTLTGSGRPADQAAARGQADIFGDKPQSSRSISGQSPGPFGPILTQYRGDAQGAIKALTELQDGEAVAALSHPEVGDIDLVWGKAGTRESNGFGLAKLVKWHPEVLDDLQGIIASLRVVNRTANRVQMESETHKAAVRLEWDGAAKHWLLTAFEKKVAEGDTRTDTAAANGLEGDTARLKPGEPSVANDESPVDPPVKSGRIEDFGQKIGGARKDAWTGFKDQLGEVSDEQIAAEPLSRVWPQPDYQALLDNGADPLAVAFVRAARDEIPNKPRQSWKVKRWAEQVKTLRTMATDVLNGTDSGRFTLDVLQSDRGALPSAAQHVKGRAALYQAVGHAKSLAGINLAFHNYTLYKGEKNVSLWTVEKEAAATAWSNWPVEIATGKTREEAIEAFKAKYDGLQTGPAKKQGASFDIIADRRTGTLWVGKKIGRNYAKLAGPFKSSSEARAHRDANLAELEDKLAKFKETPFERRDVNEPRVGEDMRAGQDVTPEFFANTFGFRGVEFGNWVEQGRRQKDLNDAFDALMDMAAVLGIPPKAISLNGELGLAFGARGSGGLKPAAAHYERDKVVINLTKKNGAGSLGHEWWHALDNYFSRARKQPSDYMTEASDVGLASRDRQFFYEDRGVRREMVQAFGAVLKAISNSGLKSRAEKLDAKRTKDYWSTDVEMSARAFEAFLINKLQDQNASNDYLANIVSPEAWKAAEKMGMELDDSYPYPTGDELPSVRAAFEQFFQTIEARETENGIALFRAPEQADGDGIQLYAPNGGSASALGKMSLDAVRKAAQTAVKGVPNAPDIEVFADPAAAGITVAPGIRPMGGTLPDGRIVLFADHIGSVIGVHQTVFHELFHRGAKVRFRSNPDYIAAMLDLAAGDVTVRRLAATWKKSADGQDKRLMYEKRGPMTGDRLANYEALAVEEALAEIAEGLAARKYKPEPTTIQRIARALARVAEVFGMARLANWLRQADASAAERFVMETLQMSGGTPNKNTTALLLKQGGVQSATQSWNVPEPGAGDAFIRAIQNNKIDVKRVRDAIQSTYGRVPDSLDAYLNEELYHGRVAARVDALHREQVEPILAKIAVAGKNAGITLDDVNLYLHARHAPERNAAMQAINPGMPNNDALSGMSNAQAANVMAGFQTSGKRQALATIARDIDQLLADVRTGLVADGLEDASDVQAWESAYKHYVPLQRDIGQADQRGNGRGMGFSVRGPEAKRAVGSDLKVVDILANIVTQAETAAIRAEKAEVGRTLLRMALAYPNPDFWQVDKVPTKPRIDPATGLVIRNAVDPMYQTADNVVMVKDYGTEHFIVFNRRSERAMAMAHAMKNLDIAQMNKILEVFNKGTRFMASLLTQRNPLFWLTNFARDVQGAMLNLEGTKAEGLQAQVVANLPKAFSGMRSLVRGNATGQWARYARELQEAGGTTGYMEVFGNSTERMQALEKEVARMQQGKADPRRLARTMLEFIDDYNDIIENTVRLSVFQAARDNGSSVKQAASIAKNITINFNRKGNLTPVVNALYMFFNASVQGTARLMQALATSRKAKVAVGSLVVIGFLLDVVNRAMAGDDEETGRNRYDLIPEFEKSRNWIFMNPARPGEYVKVPLPLGPHIFHNTGRLLSDAVNRKDAHNASEYGWSLAGLFLDAFSPLGGPQSISQLIAPSVLDPVVQADENKSFTGAPVYKAAKRPDGKLDPKPAYTRHFENTPDLWIGASKMLNDMSGGDKVKPGVINIEPDILKHGFYTLTGGPGRALDQAIDTAQAPARGREFSVNRLPLASRFYGENDDAQRERAYYDDRKRAADAKQQFDYFMKSGRPELAREVVRELGDGDEMAGRKKMATFNAADKSVRAINKQMRRELEQENPDQAERLKALRERRMKVMSNAVNDED